MNNICECTVNRIAEKLKKERVIDVNNLDAYKFGIEVSILKAIHIISYLAIASCMGKIMEFIVFFAVFSAFRQNIGGFHAKTRIGCYLFSCFVIFMSLLATELNLELWMMVLITIFDIIILFILAPVQNSNRKLDLDEFEYFRYRLITVSIMFAIIYMITIGLKGLQLISLYTIGVSLGTVLTILGKIQSE